MTRGYGRPVDFGFSLVPTASDQQASRALARRADALGPDPSACRTTCPASENEELHVVSVTRVTGTLTVDMQST